METECSSPHSQAPATCPYSEPALSSPHTHIPLNIYKQNCENCISKCNTYINIINRKNHPLIFKDPETVSVWRKQYTTWLQIYSEEAETDHDKKKVITRNSVQSKWANDKPRDKETNEMNTANVCPSEKGSVDTRNIYLTL
jgi:hypothetical protein